MDGLIGEIFFELSSTKTVYHRQVFGVLDFLGRIGGFSTVIFAVGGLFVSFYGTIHLELEIVNQVFRVRLSKVTPPLESLTNRKLQIEDLDDLRERFMTVRIQNNLRLLFSTIFGLLCK